MKVLGMEGGGRRIEMTEGEGVKRREKRRGRREV